MRNIWVLLCLALAYLTTTTNAAVIIRGHKITDHFKQLNLAPEEIDPNVGPSAPSAPSGPSGPNNIEMFDETTDEIFIGNNENEIPDEAENEVIDESINEIPQATVAPTNVAPAAAAGDTATPVKGEEETGLAKYCKCKENHCDCCRDFNFPFIPVKGPGCARMTYLGNEKMTVSLKYGDLTLASRTVSNKRARPICVGLPGGYSQFCGRIYGLSKANENFKACLGFELRADDEVEAALRVSCFKFGPEGLRVAEAEPLPADTHKDDDDDDDIFGFGAGGDDEEDEDDYDEDDDEDEEAEDDYADDDTDDEAPADADYGGFSLAGLLDELDDDDEEDSKPSSTPALTSVSSSTAAGGVTRTALDVLQSKEDKDTLEAAASAPEPTETVAPVALDVTAVNTVAEQVTSAPQSTPTTTAKTKKSKKTKRNKRKKAADTEGDFAYEFITGLLDFFN